MREAHYQCYLHAPDEFTGLGGAAAKMSYIIDDGDHKNLPLTEGGKYIPESMSLVPLKKVEVTLSVSILMRQCLDDLVELQLTSAKLPVICFAVVFCIQHRT